MPIEQGSEESEESLHKQIARLAYQLYEDGGRQQGYAEMHWLTAEEEIRQRRVQDEEPETESHSAGKRS